MKLMDFDQRKNFILNSYLGMADLPQRKFVLLSCEEPLFWGFFSGYLLV